MMRAKRRSVAHKVRSWAERLVLWVICPYVKQALASCFDEKVKETARNEIETSNVKRQTTGLCVVATKTVFKFRSLWNGKIVMGKSKKGSAWSSGPAFVASTWWRHAQDRKPSCLPHQEPTTTCCQHPGHRCHHTSLFIAEFPSLESGKKWTIWTTLEEKTRIPL